MPLTRRTTEGPGLAKTRDRILRAGYCALTSPPAAKRLSRGNTQWKYWETFSILGVAWARSSHSVRAATPTLSAGDATSAFPKSQA